MLGHDTSISEPKLQPGPNIWSGLQPVATPNHHHNLPGLWVMMDGLLQLNIRMHEVIMELRAAVRHGRANPIVINNDEEEQEEGEVVDAAPGTPVSPVRTLVEGDHTLVEIVEGTPDRDSRELSPEV